VSAEQFRLNLEAVGRTIGAQLLPELIEVQEGLRRLAHLVQVVDLWLSCLYWWQRPFARWLLSDTGAG